MISIEQGLSVEQRQAFEEHGYLVVPGLLPSDEVRLLIDTFMEMHAGGPIPGCFMPKARPKPEGEAVEAARGEDLGLTPITRPPSSQDILDLYPRMMHPHRVNDVALRYLLDARIAAILWDLFGEEPLATQSMLYFKPAGARGQALHQDNFFLKVEPGTCIAAWVALDPVDRENGGLEVVPGTHHMDIFCPEEADSATSFTREFVPVPEGLAAVPVNMAPGDVLFFNGSLVHGSPPNRSKDRFRRSFICHYIGRSSERMSLYYRPILTMDGREVEIAENTDGGPCGTEAVGPH
jgi:phytanoyl-CoA hydroxylase